MQTIQTELAMQTSLTIKIFSTIQTLIRAALQLLRCLYKREHGKQKATNLLFTDLVFLRLWGAPSLNTIRFTETGIIREEKQEMVPPLIVVGIPIFLQAQLFCRWSRRRCDNVMKVRPLSPPNSTRGYRTWPADTFEDKWRFLKRF